jgi:RHS repeat-associated protein
VQQRPANGLTQFMSFILRNSALLWLAAFTWLLGISPLSAGTFPGSARAESTGADPNSALTWNSGTNALTIACWFKISVPSDFVLSEDMGIVANNRTNSGNNHAYAIYLSASSANIEFSSRGSGGVDVPLRLIEHPQIERWYHVAVVRTGTSLTVYVDGRNVTSGFTLSGNSNSTDGISVAGWGSAKYFRGEVQEVAVYQRALTRQENFTNMLRDIPATFTGLRGYFKLGYSANPGDNLKNFASAPVSGTENLVQQGSGVVEFSETDTQGEQSAFDSKKNQGQDAIASLSGAFSWSNDAIERAGPGMPFDFGFGYSSSIGYNGQAFEGGVDVYAEDSVLGRGWRHSYQTRLVAGNLYLSVGNSYVGMMSSNGSIETWQRQSDATFNIVHKEYRGELREVESGSYIEWITPERIVHRFYHPTNWPDSLVAGRLVHIRDFNGNAQGFTYDPDSGRLATVTDTASGTWSFGYDPRGLLTTVSGPITDNAAKWTVTFTYAGITVAGAPVTVLSTKSIIPPPSYPLPVQAWNDASPGSTQWQFFYDEAGRLNRIRDPRGNDDLRIVYDTFGRKISETDANNHVTSFKYNIPSLRQLTTTDRFNAGGAPDAAQDRIAVESFDRKLRVISRKDPMGFTTSYEHDLFGNVLAMTDPRRARTVMTYDTRANITSRTNTLGEKTQWTYALTTDPPGLNGRLFDGTLLNKPLTETNPVGWQNRYAYDPKGNLLTHSDDLGTLAIHQYGHPRGLVTSSTDGNGNETTFTYEEGTGFLATRIVPGTLPVAQRTWAFSHTELGWPKTETNPLNEPIALGYNVNGQVISTTDAIGRVFTKAYDSNGNLVTESDGKGANTTFAYDPADRRSEKRDRAGKLWQFGYNTFDELIATTTPAALSEVGTQTETFTRDYDRNGRLIKETDPYTRFVSYEYDQNGNQTAMVDKTGKRWEKGFDALNRPIAERDPESNVRRTAFDAAGRVKVVTSPSGFASTHEYDGRGRLTLWIDPEGFDWEYRYDAASNIEKIIDALNGEYVMTYGARNERKTERNQDGQLWEYTYDPLVRLKTQKNPPGTGAGPGGGAVERALSYDPVGRLESVTFNTGRTNVLGYDNNNNIRNVVRTGGGQSATSLALDYDGLDRLEEARDTFNKTVRYSYDALSRVVTKVYPGGKVLTHNYDRLGRLNKLSFAFSGPPLECEFTYDDADRLTARTYPNGLAQKNTFDTSGRLTNLDHKQGVTALIALTYAYDRNGNKVTGNETGTLAWQPGAISNYDETTTFTPAGRMIQRTDATPSPDKTFSYTYDAAGNMTLATSNLGDAYALTYDEDNRTTSIQWDAGAMATKLVTNRYDALGRRISRTYEGTETRYVLDLLGDMERILCDTNAAGTVTAWYIHGADLCFKVAQNGDLTCYHADAQGNILRTTTTDGPDTDNVPDTRSEYAYTPFGRSLDTVPANAPGSDPYRFVGSQGVMLELPGIYFMRARYYSTDAAVFLATDPVRNIGAGWKPEAYGYAYANPIRLNDPDGEMPHLAAMAIGGLIKGSITEAISIGVDYASGENIDRNDILARMTGAAVGGFVEGGLAGLGVVGPAAAGVSEFVSDTIRRGIDDDEDVDMGASGLEALKAGTFNYGLNKLIPGIGGNKMTNVSSVVFGKRGVAEMSRAVISQSISKSSSSTYSLAQSGGGTSTAKKAMTAKAPGAGKYGTALTTRQSTYAAPPTITKTTTPKVKLTSTTSALKSKVTTVVKTTTKNVKAVGTKTASVVKSVVSKVKSLLSRFSKKK